MKSKQVNNGSVACKDCIVFEETVSGWPMPASPEFADAESYNFYLTARRVRKENETEDEVQISVMLTTKYRSGRTRKQCGDIALNPADANMLATAILNLKQ
jgi:hypothetical protein